MAISYYMLWKLLIDKHLSASKLLKVTSIAPNTMIRTKNNQEMSIIVLERICYCLKCDFGE